MEKAKKHEIGDPNALSLATSDKDGNPSVRMVLLKNVSEKGFIFYTNLNSKKSLDIKKNPKAAMCFYWKSLRRQIIIIGSINPVEDAIADEYFNSRDYESRIGAWASNQSETLRSRNDLLKKINEQNHKLIDRKIVKDEKDEIKKIILEWTKKDNIDVIITTGGTGLTGRDITPETLKEILSELGRVYVPALLANAKAVQAGEKTWSTEIDGQLWEQRSFPYQAKCLQWINERYQSLSESDRVRVNTLLNETGCEEMLT